MSFTTETETLPKTPQHASPSRARKAAGGKMARRSAFRRLPSVRTLTRCRARLKAASSASCRAASRCPPKAPATSSSSLRARRFACWDTSTSSGGHSAQARNSACRPLTPPALALSVYEGPRRSHRLRDRSDRRRRRAPHWRIPPDRTPLRARKHARTHGEEKTTSLTYDELFARLVLGCLRFPRRARHPACALRPTEVFEALASEDVFSAIARIVETERDGGGKPAASARGNSRLSGPTFAVLRP